MPEVIEAMIKKGMLTHKDIVRIGDYFWLMQPDERSKRELPKTPIGLLRMLSGSLHKAVDLGIIRYPEVGVMEIQKEWMARVKAYLKAHGK